MTYGVANANVTCVSSSADPLAVVAGREVGPVGVDGVAEPGLADRRGRPRPGAVHLLRLVHPGQVPLRAGHTAAVVVVAPEDEGAAVVQPGLQVAAEGLAAAEVDGRRRAGVS